MKRSGSHVKCGRGCFGCCIGPFPITAMDAARLRGGLAELDGDIARRMVERAREAAAAIRMAGYPGVSAEELFSERFAGIPCPVLDLESGACLLYAHRPVACRTYGPAIRLDGREMPHCQLNYQAASLGEVENRRVSVDTVQAGEAAWAEFLASGGVDVQTVVAFALE